jgi:hypothetical protein
VANRKAQAIDEAEDPIARETARSERNGPRRRALGGENSKPERLSRTRPIARSEERAFCERPIGRAAARRSPQAIHDSRSGLEKWALQELDGKGRSAGARPTHNSDIALHGNSQGIRCGPGDAARLEEREPGCAPRFIVSLTVRLNPPQDN